MYSLFSFFHVLFVVYNIVYRHVGPSPDAEDSPSDTTFYLHD